MQIRKKWPNQLKNLLRNMLKNIILHLFAGESHQAVKMCKGVIYLKMASVAVGISCGAPGWETGQYCPILAVPLDTALIDPLGHLVIWLCCIKCHF
jgi:hypothetical protein